MTKYIEELPRVEGEKKDRLLQEANELCALAHEQGKDDIIEWIKSNVANQSLYGTSFKDECVIRGVSEHNIEMLEWFGKNGCDLKLALRHAIELHSFPLCNELLKRGVDPNSTFEYSPSGLSMIGRKKFIETNAIGLALSKLFRESPKDLIKTIQVLLTNGAELNQSPVDKISGLVSQFFSTDNKDLQILAGTELLMQLDKRPDCQVPYYDTISLMHQFSKLFTEALKEVDIEKFPNEKEIIKEALNVVSVRFEESDPELSLRAKVLIASTQDEKNKIKARFHIQNALLALGESAPEVSIKIEGILKELQTKNISHDVAKGGGVASSTSQSQGAREEERRKSQQEEKKLSPKGFGWSIWR